MLETITTTAAQVVGIFAGLWLALALTAGFFVVVGALCLLATWLAAKLGWLKEPM